MLEYILPSPLSVALIFSPQTLFFTFTTGVIFQEGREEWFMGSSTQNLHVNSAFNYPSFSTFFHLLSFDFFF